MRHIKRVSISNVLRGPNNETGNLIACHTDNGQAALSGFQVVPGLVKVELNAPVRIQSLVRHDTMRRVTQGAVHVQRLVQARDDKFVGRVLGAVREESYQPCTQGADEFLDK